MHIVGFIFCAAVIFFAGKRLSHYGDLLAEMTGMGKALIGLVLMSAITSLPELVVGLSSAAIVKSADLATGDIMGSCAFNLGLLSLMDMFMPKNRPLFSSVSQSHILAATFGLMLVVMAGLGIFLDSDIVITPSLGMMSLSFAALYFVSIRTIYRYQRANPLQSKEVGEGDAAGLSLKQVAARYALFAVIIILAALALPSMAEQIAEQSGLGQSFVGTLFLAVSTSLPEIAVSLAAIRMGATDMAVGNLLGSNIFNIFILFLDDVFYIQGHLLKDASEANVVSVFFVVLMSATAIIGLVFPCREKRAMLAWDTWIIFMLYVVNLILLYQIS